MNGKIAKFSLAGGILGGGGGGGDDDDDDFGLTRFLGSASDFVTDFFGGSSNEKKKPNAEININRRNDEKHKKKPELIKKTPKTSNKLKSDANTQNEDSIMETIEETIEELAADEEQPTDSPTEKAESNEAELAENEETSATDKDYEDDGDDVSFNFFSIILVKSRVTNLDKLQKKTFFNNILYTIFPIANVLTFLCVLNGTLYFHRIMKRITMK